MGNCGAAHKKIEMPRSINRAMPESEISVTSHSSLTPAFKLFIQGFVKTFLLN